MKDLRDRLRLDVTARQHGAVVVEGPSDAEFLSVVLDDPHVTFFPAAGRNNVLSLADNLMDDYLRGVVCVADADFDQEPSLRAEQWFLVFTDNADVESMLFFSPVLERLLHAWGSKLKLDTLGGTNALRERVVRSLTLLSSLRAGNAAASAGIPFDAVDIAAITDKKTLVVDSEKLIARLAKAAGSSKGAIASLAVDPPPVCEHSGRLVTRGHDCLALVAIALRSLVGSLSHQKVTDNFVPKSAHMAARRADLLGSPFLSRLESAVSAALT